MSLFTPAVSYLQFDESVTHGQPFATKTLKLVSSVPLQSLELRGNAAFAECDLVRISGTDYILSVKPRDDLPVGRFGFDIQLIPRLSSGKVLVMNPTRVEGVVSAEIDASPPELSWGARRLGSTQEARVLVRSRCGQTFRITSITADSEDTKVNIVISSGDGVVLLVRHKISASGQQKHHVTVEAEVDNDTTIDVDIPIAYFGYDVGQ